MMVLIGRYPTRESYGILQGFNNGSIQALVELPTGSKCFIII